MAIEWMTIAARRFVGASVLALLGIAAPALAADSGDAGARSDGDPAHSDAWEFSIAPYLWLSGLESSVAAKDVESESDVPFSDIFDVLDFAFFGEAEARRGKLSLTGNLGYVKLSTDHARATGSVLPNAPPGSLSIDTVTDTLTVEAVANYEVAVELDPSSPLGPSSASSTRAAAGWTS